MPPTRTTPTDMPTAPLSPEMLAQFIAIETQLSPENLMADGERPAAAAERIKRSLRARWKALEAEVGRPVGADEVWEQYMETRRARPIGTTDTYR
jgi:hypothetical protein